MLVSRSLVVWGVAVLAGGLLAGCSTPINRAPVEDRGTFAASSGTTGSAGAVPEVKPLPGAENAGKPGYYTVKPGDTLIRIGLENGQSWKDIARWNNLENANLIEVGQVLRVVPPVAAAATAVASDTGVVTRPVTSSPLAAASAASAPKPSASAASTPAAVAPAAAPSAPAVATAPAAAAATDDVNFIWPSSGSLLAGFDEVRNKGYDIGGKAGDPVLAAADGRVVYAGAGLRGYGNLVILKHNNTYLTAYAHNQTLLVKEDQNVRRGQKIAEMGSTDADRVKLHFEIRRQGKPVDPARYLPSR
ncbi:peptidoglycan DD-metalloendopeptidase family protein [Diaphorobacter sp. MNS-0]|uniref:peptidoglycan DD-metalloendopeptidase family protein n=1 Tax=Diaphorobacter sp. MNS-0 TaxID=2866628 RepID=UPI001C72C358|nr:peptidoglycan DD-metalloendopeptidase family protein [Diaphorobacter sp. MNS-0]QYY26699.1 peptidoglycan DD-metalloendopeptidase family protein [Diaphorobacter sp. MNS-0]